MFIISVTTCSYYYCHKDQDQIRDRDRELDQILFTE